VSVGHSHEPNKNAHCCPAAVMCPDSFVDCGTIQGWVFAMAKTIFAGTVEKTGKNRGKD